MISPLQSDVDNGDYDAARHIFAVFTAGAIFTLILAGALVTSNDAGLSVPDWPTTFGSIYRIPPMVGGVRFEHGHRMLAEFVGLLTIILALWTWRKDERRWMRRLSIAALAVVIMQGILGGLTVLYFLPPAVSTAHAALGQTFFCITVIIAIFSGRRSMAAPKSVFQPRGHRIARLALISVGALYIQLILGGLFRHGGLSWWPHVANSIVVIAMLAWTVFLTLSNYKNVDQLRKPALLILILLVSQVCLGGAAFYTRVVQGHEALQPHLPMVISTVAHVGVGALLLATTVIFTVRVCLIGLQPTKIGIKLMPNRDITAGSRHEHVDSFPAWLFCLYRGAGQQELLRHHQRAAQNGERSLLQAPAVAGNVQLGSIKRSGTHVQFVLVEQDQLLSVDYTGTEAPPDTFKDDSQALADGSFGRDGVFHAKALQAKCASKYAPQQPGNQMQAEPTKSVTQVQTGSQPTAAST